MTTATINQAKSITVLATIEWGKLQGDEDMVHFRLFSDDEEEASHTGSSVLEHHDPDASHIEQLADEWLAHLGIDFDLFWEDVVEKLRANEWAIILSAK